MRIDGIGGLPSFKAVREADSIIEPQATGALRIRPETRTPGTTEPTSHSFGETLMQAIGSVNDLQLAADRQAQAVATGEAQDLHTAMIAMERAEIALQATVQVTQKAIEAYKEVSRMQV